MAFKLSDEEIENKLEELGDGWKLTKGHLTKEFNLDNFKSALDLTIKIGEIAEKLNHHPNIRLTWGEVIVEIWTHEVDGLTEKDFELAASFDKLGG